MKPYPFIFAVLLASTFAVWSDQVWVASRPFNIDRVYTSMQGPIQYRTGFSPLAKGEEAWIVGMHVELVGEGGAAAEQDMFCHANLWRAPIEMKGNSRLITLIPGRTSIRFPEGFGLKITGNDPLELYQQALNLDPKRPHTTVRFKTTLEYEKKAQKDLEMLTAVILLPLKDHELPEELCAAPNIKATLRSACAPSVSIQAGMMNNTDDLMTLHWMVPPGRHTFRTSINPQLNLKGKPVVHYVTGHLHPFGETLKLVEKQTQTEVFTLGATLDAKKLGVGHVDDWTSPTGVELNAEKEYELVAQYNNLTAKPVDAMGIIYLYTAKNGVQN